MNNTTDGNESDNGGMSPIQIATLTTSIVTVVGGLLYVAYAKMKQHFRDIQSSSIELESEVTNKDKTTSITKIKIVYNNDEQFGKETVTVTNSQGQSPTFTQNLLSTLSEKIGIKSKENDSMLPEENKGDLHEFMENNHEGDTVIASTRSSLARKALNAFISAVAMAHSGKSQDAQYLKQTLKEVKPEFDIKISTKQEKTGNNKIETTKATTIKLKDSQEPLIEKNEDDINVALSGGDSDITVSGSDSE